MVNQSCYVLLEDPCETCSFISNAFTLLNLPLKRLKLQDITYETDFSYVISLIVCRNFENKNIPQLSLALDKINNLILFKNSQLQCQISDKNLCLLPIPFSIEQFKETLSCSKRHHDQRTSCKIDHDVFSHLIGKSAPMQKIKLLIQQVANCDSNVLILGESGTGKDVIANCIHSLSNRAKQPFVPVNCGAIPAELMESELFGHEKGAFTGAVAKRQGRFEIAQNGTLFLDEIGDMPFSMQVKLLRVIQDRQIERIGGSECSNHFCNE